MVLEAAGTSLTSVHFYQTTRRHIPEYSNFHCHRSETEISLRRGYYIKLGKYEKNGDKEVQFLSFNEEEWSVSVFERFYTREKGPLLNRRLCGPQNQFRRYGKDKYLPAIQLVHDIFCFSTNCNWVMKFGPSATQAARRIYRSDSKEVNGELRKLRSEELHDCAPKEFN